MWERVLIPTLCLFFAAGLVRAQDITTPITADVLLEQCRETGADSGVCIDRINRVLEEFSTTTETKPAEICGTEAFTNEYKYDLITSYLESKASRNAAWLTRQDADRLIAIQFMLRYPCME